MRKKITFSFSSTKDPWGLDFKQLRDQAGLYEEAGMAMNALWEVRIAQLFFPETKIRLLTGALLGWHFLFHWSYSCLISSSKGVYENLYSTIFNQHLTGPWQDQRVAQPEGFCPHGVLLYEQVNNFTVHLVFLMVAFLHIRRKTSADFSSTDCFASASPMASSFSSWSGWRTVARILSERRK